MDATTALSRLTDQPALDPIAEPLSKAVRQAYELAGPAGQTAKNAAHGVWLGHPLHPAFTDLPLGAWTTGLVLDAVGAVNGDEAMEHAGDVAIAVGLAGAAAAAVTGLTDWSETSGQPRRTGLIHGLLNIAATSLYAAALVLRRRGARTSGQSCAIAGYGIALGAAWFGGNLVFDQRIGVTHAVVDEPDTFTAVARAADLPDDSMMRVRHEDLDLLAVRQQRRVCVLAHSCSHLGGPLSEGTLKDGSVVCPWHGSEFALDDGHVINGPATQNQPCLDARERAGKIEVKAHTA
jgi:nitrite reductase/ring-hydroxylating ferredoxin subunit